MDKETAEAARKFAKKIKKAYSPQKIILFGSRARGDNFRTSDYDFIIVSRKFEGINFFRRMSSIYDYWDGPFDIEPLCYTPDEFEKKSGQIGIVKRAVQEGIEF